MNKFLFKSTDADFKKLSSNIDTIQKNVLYVTYRIDMLIKRFDKVLVDKDLQKQVDDYFETSPQTDSDEQ